MAICKFGGLDIPAVSSQQVGYTMIGDRARTASGRLRQDIVAIKREWRVQTGKLTKQESDNIVQLLMSISFRPAEFWLDEFGDEENTVLAYCEVEKEERATFGRDGGWHSDGRRLTLKFVEQ